MTTLELDGRITEDGDLEIHLPVGLPMAEFLAWLNTNPSTNFEATSAMMRILVIMSTEYADSLPLLSMNQKMTNEYRIIIPEAVIGSRSS
jgi:hypothetical protein